MENKEIINRLNQEILDCIPAFDYAKEHAEEIVETAYKNTVRKVYTTNGDDLGIASPDIINHRVIGGSKKGKVIKSVPEGKSYCEIGYDADDKPLYYKHINTFGREDTEFIFEYDGNFYALTLEDCFDGKRSVGYKAFSKPIKYRFDELGRIAFYAIEISVPKGGDYQPKVSMFGDLSNFAHIIANYYEYPDSDVDSITCHHYYYVTHMSRDGKVDENAKIQFSENYYEISPDQKTITEYRKQKDGELVFSRKIESGRKKTSKSSVFEDNYKKFEEWLDSQLEKDIPSEGGVYFDLFGPNEDGFGIYLDITEDFTPDDDDWACNVIYNSENMFMVNPSEEIEYDKATKEAAKLIKKYLKEGKNKDTLKKYKGIGTAFPDSDILYI